MTSDKDARPRQTNPRPRYELEEVDEIPRSADRRTSRAPLRLIVTRIIENADTDRTYRIATYSTPIGATKARQRFRKRWPELAAMVRLENRRVDLEGGTQGSQLYATYDPPGS